MKNRNIVLASVVLILLGALIAYQYTQKTKKDTAGANDKKIVQEKKVKNNNLNIQEEEKAPIDDNAVIAEGATIYFYGEECPHCKDVIAFLDKNDIYSKVDFVKKEVWHNKSNGEELRKAALKCGMNPANIGVPFLFSEEKCYMGGPDVIEFFSKKAGLK